MSSKSKRKAPRRLSPTQQMNRDLLIFLWAWVSVKKPTAAEIYAVKDEIIKVSDSVRMGLVNETMIAQQLAEEFGVLTDWARRDRG